MLRVYSILLSKIILKVIDKGNGERLSVFISQYIINTNCGKEKWTKQKRKNNKLLPISRGL